MPGLGRGVWVVLGGRLIDNLSYQWTSVTT
jgi:hypothetical protein